MDWQNTDQTQELVTAKLRFLVTRYSVGIVRNLDEVTGDLSNFRKFNFHVDGMEKELYLIYQELLRIKELMLYPQ